MGCAGRRRPLDMALAHARSSIFHSDQGSQYAARRHTDRLLDHRITISMSDQNGLVERFIRTLKNQPSYYPCLQNQVA
jgi:transposase InsO family protein